MSDIGGSHLRNRTSIFDRSGCPRGPKAPNRSAERNLGTSDSSCIAPDQSCSLAVRSSWCNALAADGLQPGLRRNNDRTRRTAVGETPGRRAPEGWKQGEGLPQATAATMASAVHCLGSYGYRPKKSK